MDESFKDDVSLLVTECLIRAIEVRTSGSSKVPEEQRQAAVEQSVKQGYVLTPYFYDALAKFEKSPVGLRNGYSDLISAIDLGKEEKRAAQIQFATAADPELLQATRTRRNSSAGDGSDTPLRRRFRRRQETRPASSGHEE